MSSAVRRGRPKIKPPRRHGSDISIDNTWSQLSKNVVEILNHNAANLSFEENHRFAYNMVLHKNGETLYKGVNQLVSDNLDALASTHVIPAFPTSATEDAMQRSQEDERLLKEMRNIWDDHTGSMLKLGQVLKYMDRVYTQTANVPDIWNSGLDLFIKRIIQPPIDDHVVAAVLKQIQYERDGYTINRSAVKGCVGVFLALKSDNATLYQRDIEPAVLRDSKTFYKAEAAKLLDTCDASEYLRRVDERLSSEESRVFHYLSSHTTAVPLRNIVKTALLTPHLYTVVSMPNSGLDSMIDCNKLDDLSRLYRLFMMVPEGLECLRKSLKDSILRRGIEVNQASLDETLLKVVEAEPSAKGKGKVKAVRPPAGSQTLALALNWVQEVLSLKDKFDVVWKGALQSDRDIEGALTDAFQTFINKHEKSPEYISLFIDENLKKGLKGKTEIEVDEVLDKTITVFRYLTEKDVFDRYYQGHLAKRLLSGRSVSDDAERGMLARLKIENGSASTQKLEAMFNDMKLSADTMVAYRAHLEKTTAPSIDLSVTVMTSTFWPITTSGPCTLPHELIRACQSFEQFYLSRHSGRRLTWQPSLGNADIRVLFGNGKRHELNVSTFAMVILLLFQDTGDDEFLTYEEIKAATSIADVELSRHLQSLACAKFKILKKHPPGREVDPSDSFSFNRDFSCPLLKIKINTIASKVETGEERKETRDRVEEERRHQTEACLVRIMKDRKHLTHNELINEATKQLAPRFLPDPLSVKKRIEGLIERDYLERCEDRKSYNYMA